MVWAHAVLESGKQPNDASLLITQPHFTCSLNCTQRGLERAARESPNDTTQGGSHSVWIRSRLLPPLQILFEDTQWTLMRCGECPAMGESETVQREPLFELQIAGASPHTYSEVVHPAGSHCSTTAGSIIGCLYSASALNTEAEFRRLRLRAGSARSREAGEKRESGRGWKLWLRSSGGWR